MAPIAQVLQAFHPRVSLEQQNVALALWTGWKGLPRDTHGNRRRRWLLRPIETLHISDMHRRIGKVQEVNAPVASKARWHVTEHDGCKHVSEERQPSRQVVGGGTTAVVAHLTSAAQIPSARTATVVIVGHNR